MRRYVVMAAGWKHSALASRSSNNGRIIYCDSVSIHRHHFCF